MSATSCPVPAIRAERCIICCMTCGRSTTAATYVVEGLFGWLPYGRVTSRLHCRKGCGDRFGMVLPVDAPTPRAYAERYDLAPDARPSKPFTPDLEEDCRDRLVEVGQGGTFLKVHAKSEDPLIMHGALTTYSRSSLRAGESLPASLLPEARNGLATASETSKWWEANLLNGKTISWIEPDN